MEYVRPTTGAGLCSCLTVRLNDTCDYYRKNGRWPDQVDSSQQFTMYKDTDSTNVSDFILGEYKYDHYLPFLPFNCGWQYGWYDEVNIQKLSRMADVICPVSSIVGDKSFNMIQDRADRTAILYRGNDKCKEIPSAGYDVFFEMARSSESEKFLVQTDEIEFLQEFKKQFPDTICFNELPRINRNANSYVMPAKGNRVTFAINFIAALRAISQAEKLIIGTGNTSLWAMLYRGHHENVWQFHGNYNKWRKL